MNLLSKTIVFSLRAESREELEVLGAKVSDALGISFTMAGYASNVSPYLQAEALGMVIQLGAWPAYKRDGVYTYQFHGVPQKTLVLDENTEEVDLSDYIGVLLEIGGTGNWRRPTREEILKEIEISERLDSDS